MQSMKKLLTLVFSVLVLISCQKKEDKNKTEKEENKESCAAGPTKGKKFEMYKMSEMASLMEQMYAYNRQIKDRIVKGDTVGKFPEFFNKIYTAEFTTSSDNDDFFKENAKKYITAQKLIYSNPNNVIENFNKGVDACVTCHQGKCGGPIPRIKKLYIK
jgi:hypothetical protein